MTTHPPDRGRPDDDRTALRPTEPAPPSASSATPGTGPGGPSRRRPRRRSRAPFVVVVCALAVILGMAGGIAFVIRYGGGAGVGGATPSPSASPSPTPKPTDPAAVVRSYLEALSRGDAQAALALGKTQPADTAFTTNAVLGRAVQAHPITKINVPDVPQTGPTPDDTATVEASYLIGDERITSSFDLTWVGQGYRLDETTTDWDVSSLRSKRVPLRIAGKKVNSDSVTLLPGAYPITTGLRYLSWGDHTMLVKKPDDYVSSSGFDLTINTAGTRKLRREVKQHLDHCVARKDPQPSGCPFAYTNSSYKIKNKTVAWSFQEDPLADFDPQLSYDRDGVAKVSLSLELSFKAKGVRTFDDKSMKIDDTVTSYATATADLTGDTVRVTWED